MLNFSEIVDRIMRLENTSKKTDIANLLDSNTSKFSVWERRNTIPLENLLTYCRNRELSIHWLLTGEGPRHIPDPASVLPSDYALLRAKAAKYDQIIEALGISPPLDLSSDSSSGL